MRIRPIVVSLALGWLLPNPGAVAQTARPGEQGLPIITNYSPRDYRYGDLQNWSVTQDGRGVMYFGNSPGILEYDGSEWRWIELPNHTTARSLSTGPNGQVYVGAVRDLGYLDYDETGSTEFVSLLDDIPENERDFADVWNTHATDEGVYFNTNPRLFLWKDHAVKSWTSENGYHVGAYVNGKYYVREFGVGLEVVGADGPELVPGGERFANERVYVMLPYDDHRMLMVTRTEGSFLFDGSKFTAFPTEADDYIKQNLVYMGGRVLLNGNFAIPTINAGVVIIDRQGSLVDIIDKAAGLQDNSVLYTYLDRAGDLWIGLNQGIARVEYGSPIRVFDDRSGVVTWYSDLARFQGELFGASQTGLFKLDGKSGQWNLVPGTNNQTFSLAPFDDRMLVAASIEGLYEYRSGRLTLVKGTTDNSYAPFTLLRSSIDSSRVWIGLGPGFGSIRMGSDGKWIDEGVIPNLDRAVTKVVERPDGTLWVGSYEGGAYRIRFPDRPADWASAEVAYYGSEKGLSDYLSLIFEIEGEFFVGSDQGVSRYDEASDRFVPEPRLNALEPGLLAAWSEKRDGSYWVTLGRNIAVVTPQLDGSYSVDLNQLSRLADDRPSAILREPDAAWIATLDGIVRYDAKQRPQAAAAFPTLLRSVMVGRDSLIYHGGPMDPDAVPLIPFSHNSVEFDYANPSYQEVLGNVYETRLDGFEASWSPWSTEPRRDYTNLHPGDYEFHVRSRDAMGNESPEAAYAFSILPPWYRTWFAYGIYAVVLLLAGFAVDRIQRRRLLKAANARMELQESQLRAEAAESDAKRAEAEAKALHAENERHKNIALLTEIGQAITATLSIKGIIDTVYENVNALMDASVFTIGIHDKENDQLDFPATREKGESLEPYSNDLSDENRLAVICFKERREILINDWGSQHAEFVKQWAPPLAGEDPSSIIYLPLVTKDRVIGVISAQSFEKDAYSEYHLNVLRNLATYAAIALDNAEAYSRLNATVEELNKTLQNLKTTQEQLVTQEKMASLGQLTAGIAHEIKNPLNFVNNFADLNAELAKDLSTELASNRDKKIAEVYEELSDMLASLKINAQQISKHGRRADSIVRNMMEHASGGSSERFRVEVNPLVDEYIGLSYHGMRAQTPDLNVTIRKDFDDDAGNAEMAPREIGRVLLNLLNNAIYAVHERARSEGGDFEPTVTVATKRKGGRIEIEVVDNGGGIPESIKEKIFEPLFTTKPTGSGTGLGLSLSFDIVTNGHGGSLTLQNEEGKGATFVVSIPV